MHRSIARILALVLVASASFACKARDSDAGGLMDVPSEAATDGTHYVIVCAALDGKAPDPDKKLRFLWEVNEQKRNDETENSMRVGLTRVVGTSKQPIASEANGRGSIDLQGQLHVNSDVGLLTAEYVGIAGNLTQGRTHQGVMSLKDGAIDYGVAVECAAARR